jgi:hypothetical protein
MQGRARRALSPGGLLTSIAACLEGTAPSPWRPRRAAVGNGEPRPASLGVCAGAGVCQSPAREQVSSTPMWQGRARRALSPGGLLTCLSHVLGENDLFVASAPRHRRAWKTETGKSWRLYWCGNPPVTCEGAGSFDPHDAGPAGSGLRPLLSRGGRAMAVCHRGMAPVAPLRLESALHGSHLALMTPSSLTAALQEW